MLVWVHIFLDLKHNFKRGFLSIEKMVGLKLKGIARTYSLGNAEKTAP